MSSHGIHRSSHCKQISKCNKKWTFLQHSWHSLLLAITHTHVCACICAQQCTHNTYTLLANASIFVRICRNGHVYIYDESLKTFRCWRRLCKFYKTPFMNPLPMWTYMRVHCVCLNKKGTRRPASNVENIESLYNSTKYVYNPDIYTQNTLSTENVCCVFMLNGTIQYTILIYRYNNIYNRIPSICVYVLFSISNPAGTLKSERQHDESCVLPIHTHTQTHTSSGDTPKAMHVCPKFG